MGRRIAIATALFVAIALVAAVSWDVTRRHYVARSSVLLKEQLTLIAETLESEIERFSTLPRVVAEDQRIAKVLGSPDPISVQDANIYLTVLRERTGADQIYVLDPQGTALASSNWAEERSFVGHNYGFRPYFQDAMQNGAGRYYAVGVTSGVPGYFISSRMPRPGGGFGVVVVKLSLEPVEGAWMKAGALTALVDGEGVVFLSGVPEWKYRPLQMLSQSVRAELEAQRKYDGLRMDMQEPLFPALDQVESEGLNPSETSVWEHDGMLFRLTPIPEDGWALIGARSVAGPTAAANMVAVLTALTGLLLAVGAFMVKQRRQLIRIRLNQNAILERRVVERTAELAAEVETRRRTEQHLRETQEELVQAAKLAVLGQMSAAIVHEICQPLSAMDANLMAAERNLEKGRRAESAALMGRARGLVERMRHTVRHLRSYARKDGGATEPVNIGTAITAAMELAEPRARELGATLDFAKPMTELTVAANSVRLEQVLLNLVLNALDAVEGRSERRIRIHAYAYGTMVSIEIADTGAGIPEGMDQKVMQPFFTTKSGADGLGLGLSISQSILADYGGELMFRSRRNGGTVCEVHLPRTVALEPVQAAE